MSVEIIHSSTAMQYILTEEYVAELVCDLVLPLEQTDHAHTVRTDVLKALCLGAKAVGMGRPFLYALSAYGEAGVVKTVHILEREIITSMRLLGVSSLQELTPDMVSLSHRTLSLTVLGLSCSIMYRLRGLIGSQSMLSCRALFTVNAYGGAEMYPSCIVLYICTRTLPWIVWSVFAGQDMAMTCYGLEAQGLAYPRLVDGRV